MPNSELRQVISTHVLEKINDIASSVANVDRFAREVVDLIRTEFKFYFMGVFLVDATGQWICFRAGTGEAGRIMREAGHRIGIDSQGMIGIATRENKICIDDFRSSGSFFVNALPSDVQQKPTLSLQRVDDPRRPSPLLPDTRSQMIVPLRRAKGVIGAIDIHSDKPDDFSSEDISVFLPIADQIARFWIKLLEGIDKTDN